MDSLRDLLGAYFCASSIEEGADGRQYYIDAAAAWLRAVAEMVRDAPGDDQPPRPPSETIS